MIKNNAHNKSIRNIDDKTQQYQKGKTFECLIVLEKNG